MAKVKNYRVRNAIIKKVDKGTRRATGTAKRARGRAGRAAVGAGANAEKAKWKVRDSGRAAKRKAAPKMPGARAFNKPYNVSKAVGKPRKYSTRRKVGVGTAAGAAVGVGGVVAYKNRAKIKSGAQKVRARVRRK